MTSDPYEASGGAGEPGSWGRASYVVGDPSNFNDSSGLSRCYAISINENNSGKVRTSCTLPLGTTIYIDVGYNPQKPESKILDQAVIDAEESAIYRQLLEEETHREVAGLMDLAARAFEHAECAKLFSGIDVMTPKQALDTMWNRISVQFAPIVNLTGPPVDGRTVGVGTRVGFRSEFPYVGTYSATANITLNSSIYGGLSQRERLSLFIHEFGHAIGFLSIGKITGGFIHPDPSAKDNDTNNGNVMVKCVNKVM